MNDLLKSRVVSHQFFQSMNPEHLEIVTGCASEVAFKPDQVLFLESEPASQFYLIESGRIALETHDPAKGTALVQNLGAGDVLGWSWLFPPFAWHFQARAVEPSKAIALNAGHLLAAAERDRDFGYELMKRVAQVVIQRLQAARRRFLNEAGCRSSTA